MSLKTVSQKLAGFISTKTPIVCFISEEERRIERFLREFSAKIFSKPIPFYVWNCVEGIVGDNGPVPETIDIADAFRWTLKQTDTHFVLFKDIKYYITDSPQHIRMIKDIYNKFYTSYSTAFFLLPSLDIPLDVQREITVLDVGLPALEEVEETFDRLIASSQNAAALKENLPSNTREQLVKAALGLGEDDIERAFARLLSKDKTEFSEKDVQEVVEEKHQIVAKSGILEFNPLDTGLADLGGMENLKAWLKRRETIFTKEAREFGLRFPKGILVMGISGCGKSLLIKVCASFWGIPLIRLDMGRIYDETLGVPEASLRYAIKVAESCAPCVLWVDEIEGGIANTGAKSRGGPASRVISYFLTWMQEKQSPVFVGATANEIELVPPEFIRKGRFDEIFYVTLPNIQEREQIFGIHLRRRGIDPTKINLQNLAKSTEGYNGAEIEQIVISAQFEAFQQKRPVNEHDVFVSVGRIVPLSTTMKEDIKRLERWAFNRTVKASK